MNVIIENKNSKSLKMDFQTINDEKLYRNYFLFNFPRRVVLEIPFNNKVIISYGLIVYAKNTQRFAIVQRKHSVEFLLFMRGFYRLSYLPMLLSCITENEASIIKECLNRDFLFFSKIYLEELNLNKDGLFYAYFRIKELESIIFNLLLKLDLSNNQLSWNWPKGRINSTDNKESCFDCAKREFIEETEINLPPPLYVSSNYINKITKTFTDRGIESRYWIYIIPNEIEMSQPKHNVEVSNRLWADIKTCKTLVNQNDILDKAIEIINKATVNFNC